MIAPRIAVSMALAAFAAPAFAAGPTAVPAPIPAPLPPAATIYDWSGPSVGLQFGRADIETSGAAELEGDGGIVGLRAAYDWDFGTFIAGAGLDYDFADIDLEGAATVENVLRVKGRVGFDSNRNWYYATVGWARAYTGADAVDVGDSDGYFVGLGYEVYVTPRFTAGAEALWHKFEDFDLEDLEVEATTLQLSVNYRF